MSFDLTNKNISDTYQNLLQKTGSDNQLFDLLGNPVQNLTIQGALIAESYIVSQSTTVFSSGSTAFGNSSDDSHLFTGNITASGNISSSGTILGATINSMDEVQSQGHRIGEYDGTRIRLGDSAKETLLFGSQIQTSQPFNVLNNSITASGNISASGTVFANSGSFNYITASIIDVDADTIRFGGEPFTKTNIQALKQGRSLKPLRAGKDKPDIEGDRGIFDGEITASGNISSSANILGNFIVSNGIMIGQHNGTTTFLAADTKPTEIQGTNIELDAPVTASGDISASGIVFGSDIKSNGTSVVKSITDLSDNTTNQGKIQFTNTANVSVVKNISNLGSGDNPTFNNITASGDIFKTKLVQMTNSSSVIDTFNTGSFRSAKYVLQVISASNFQVSEMLVLHHNSTASNTEYAQINSGINLINFTTDVNNSNVRLNAAGSFISCSVRYDRTIIPL